MNYVTTNDTALIATLELMGVREVAEKTYAAMNAVMIEAYAQGFGAGRESVPVDEIEDEAYDEGHADGWTVGYGDGLEDEETTFKHGYDAGHEEGHAEGYSDGYYDGVDEEDMGVVEQACAVAGSGDDALNEEITVEVLPPSDFFWRYGWDAYRL